MKSKTVDGTPFQPAPPEGNDMSDQDRTTEAREDYAKLNANTRPADGYGRDSLGQTSQQAQEALDEIDRLRRWKAEAMKDRTVWPVAVDYGLNGAGMYGVFTTKEAAEAAAAINWDGDVTGYGGPEVTEMVLDVVPEYLHESLARRVKRGYGADGHPPKGGFR